MTLTIQDLGALGELLGSIAVLATLVYLALQTRHARRAGLTQAPQWISDGYRSWFIAPRQDPEFGRLVLNATHSWSELSALDQFRTHCWWAEMIVHLDAVLTFRAQGLIDEPRTVAWVDNSLGLIQTPGGREWWSETKFLYSPQVRDELERRLEDPSNLPDAWTKTLTWFRPEALNRGATGSGPAGNAAGR